MMLFVTVCLKFTAWFPTSANVFVKQNMLYIQAFLHVCNDGQGLKKGLNLFFSPQSEAKLTNNFDIRIWH